MRRSGGRGEDELRPIEFVTNYTKWAEGSVLAKFGDTHVLCNVTIESRVPRWLYVSDKNHGWLSAEYSLLPRSTEQRHAREQKWPRGRTQEISRLIGRSLRMALDLQALGSRHLLVDCDVIQADGGTRTAAITGAWVALNLALQPLIYAGEIPKRVIRQQIAAISVGMYRGAPLLDLDYHEDSNAEADMNVVMTSKGQFIEVQGTAEQAPVSREQFDVLLDMAADGIGRLFVHQDLAIA